MAGKFELFRLSLIPKPQIDAFEKSKQEKIIYALFLAKDISLNTMVVFFITSRWKIEMINKKS